MMKYTIDGEYFKAEIDEDHYYCTDKDGYGLFLVDSAKNSRTQIEGALQFSVHGIKDKKAKFRRWLKSDDKIFSEM